MEAAFDQTRHVAQLRRDRPVPATGTPTDRGGGDVQRRLLSVVELILALGFPGHRTSPAPHPTRGPNLGHDQLLAACAELLEPDADRLRCPAETARVLRLLTFAASHPKITDEEPMTAEQIVALLLHGILRRRPGRVRPC